MSDLIGRVLEYDFKDGEGLNRWSVFSCDVTTGTCIIRRKSTIFQDEEIQETLHVDDVLSAILESARPESPSKRRDHKVNFVAIGTPVIYGGKLFVVAFSNGTGVGLQNPTNPQDEHFVRYNALCLEPVYCLWGEDDNESIWEFIHLGCDDKCIIAPPSDDDFHGDDFHGREEAKFQDLHVFIDRHPMKSGSDTEETAKAAPKKKAAPEKKAAPKARAASRKKKAASKKGKKPSSSSWIREENKSTSRERQAQMRKARESDWRSVCLRRPKR